MSHKTSIIFIYKTSPFVGGLRKSLAALPAARGGVAALEFALVLPVLLVALLGFVELDRYVTSTRQLESASNSISEMLSQSTSKTNGDLNFAYDSLMVLFPRVLEDSARKAVAWRNDINVSMSSIAFASTVPGCVANCTYKAQVAWSSGSAKRPCSVPLSPVADNSTPTPTTLPQSAFGPNGLVAVDLEFTYTPLFAPKLFGSMTIKRSSFLQARDVAPLSYLKFDPSAGNSLVTTCPGY